MKTFIRSYTDLYNLKKNQVYAVATFGPNKILLPYYGKDNKQCELPSRIFNELASRGSLAEVQPMRKEGTSEIWFVHRQEPDSIWSDRVSEKLSGIMSDDTLAHFTPVQL